MACNYFKITHAFNNSISPIIPQLISTFTFCGKLSSPWHLRFSGLNFSWCAWVALLAVFLSVMPSGVDGFDERSGVDDWREPSFLLYIYLYILVYIYIYIFVLYILYIYIYIYIHSSMMKLFWENSYRLSPEAAALTCFWK